MSNPDIRGHYLVSFILLKKYFVLLFQYKILKYPFPGKGYFKKPGKVFRVELLRLDFELNSNH